MRWRDKRRSSNIEDRRGKRRAGGVKMGGGLGFILLIILFIFLGKNPIHLLNDGGSSSSQYENQSEHSQINDEAADFVSVVLASTEDAWTPVFESNGLSYQAPKLVLFKDAVQSACGMTSAATGPFYCPGDSKVYIDLGFFRELERFGATGDFARAYVIAHEVGHHIQNLQGISMAVQKLQRQVSEKDANQLSVLTELQADCYAGVWIHHYEKQADLLENGDIEEGIRAAASIGDDRMQRYAGQRVNPDSFTHGSSRDRTQWFKIGMKYGSVSKCNTLGQAGVKL